MLGKFRLFIPFAIVITAMCGLLYLVGQQNLRQSANDPQIQMAEDIAILLAKGKPPVARVPENRVDLRKTLSVFSMVFDKTGKLLVSSGHIDGNAPTLPQGVLSASKRNGEDRLTWQPMTGVRIAAVITYYKGANEGYVLVGRSLREVEKREQMLLWHVGIAWIITMMATFVATNLFMPAYFSKKK